MKYVRVLYIYIYETLSYILAWSMALLKTFWIGNKSLNSFSLVLTSTGQRLQEHRQSAHTSAFW